MNILSYDRKLDQHFIAHCEIGDLTLELAKVFILRANVPILATSFLLTPSTFMRHYLLSSILPFTLLMLLLGCKTPQKQQDSDLASDNQVLVDLPLAVPNPSEKPQIEFLARSMHQIGLPIMISLPEEVVIKRDESLQGWVLMDPKEEFRLIMQESRLSMEEIVNFWKGNPEDYRFRLLKINSPDGILIEVERNGKIEYHVDYILPGPEGLRLYNAKDKPFSEHQATMMFHACRTAKVIPEELQ